MKNSYLALNWKLRPFLEPRKSWNPKSTVRGFQTSQGPKTQFKVSHSKLGFSFVFLHFHLRFPAFFSGFLNCVFLRHFFLFESLPGRFGSSTNDESHASSEHTNTSNSSRAFIFCTCEQNRCRHCSVRLPAVTSQLRLRGLQTSHCEVADLAGFFCQVQNLVSAKVPTCDIMQRKGN